ncbi:MAG TPA: hypothetical protein VFY93_05895 [Planctomycetota bacterium]|nr:hypothetical protein [Planctomycetota bacterium]
MSALTAVENRRLPVIIDDEILSAPVVRSQLRDRGMIAVADERVAGLLAATLGGGALPSKPTFVAERRIEPSADEWEQDGAELLYEFRDGEARAAANVLEKRLELLGVEGTAKALEDGRRVLVRIGERDRLEDARAVLAWVGHMEFRREISGGDWLGYPNCWRAFAAARKQGTDVEGSRDVPAASLSTADRERWPNGLRWYRDVDSQGEDNWTLCEIGSIGFTEKAFEDIRIRLPLRDGYAVELRVKADFRDKMAKLWGAGYPVIGIIVDDEIVCETCVDVQSEHGSITVQMGSEARRIVAAFGGGLLPSKPALVAERRIER